MCFVIDDDDLLLLLWNTLLNMYSTFFLSNWFSVMHVMMFCTLIFYICSSLFISVPSLPDIVSEGTVFLGGPIFPFVRSDIVTAISREWLEQF